MWTGRGTGLRIRARPARAGAPLELTVVIDAEDEVELKAVEVSLVAETTLDERVTRVVILHDRLEVLGGSLRAGRSELPVTLELPAGLPPSTREAGLGWRYVLVAQIDDRLFGPGTEVRYDLPVAPPADDTPAPGPQSFAHKLGDGRGQPLLSGEVVHEDEQLVVHIYGGRELAAGAYDVRLEGHVHDGAQGTSFVGPVGNTVPVRGGRFSSNIPRAQALPSSFEVGRTRLRWTLRVRAFVEGARTIDFSGAVDVRWKAPRGHDARAPVPTIMPTVPTVTRAVEVEGVAGARATAHVEEDGQETLYAARLSYEPLELGLFLARTRTDTAATHEGFTSHIDATHARDRDQALVFAEGLTRRAQLLVSMDDTRAILEARGYATDEAFDAFLDAVRDFAAQLQAARQAIPPPARFAAQVPRWRELAERLTEGVFVPASMRAHGRFGGWPAEVAVDWSQRGRALRASLDPIGLADEPFVTELDGAALDVEAALAALARLADQAVALRGRQGPYR